MKEIGGVPDELAKNEEELEIDETSSKSVCKAFTSYIYGNSIPLKKYEKVFDRVYFPMTIDYYGNEYTDLRIKSGETQELGTPGKTTAYQFRRVIFEKGAQIKFVGRVDFSADEHIREANDDYPSKDTVFGTDTKISIVKYVLLARKGKAGRT